MYLVDGSNLLGALRMERTSIDVQRWLLAAVASFCRAKRTKALLIFDGPPPAGFARELGHVRAIFSAPESADDRIVRELARLDGGGGATVVTSDRGLAKRVQSRRVKVVDSARFGQELAVSSADTAAGRAGADDWEAYFSDEKNRMDF